MGIDCSCGLCTPQARQFMLECEARQLLRWPIEQRRNHLAARAVQARRQRLERELIRQHQLMRNPAPHGFGSGVADAVEW